MQSCLDSSNRDKSVVCRKQHSVNWDIEFADFAEKFVIFST